MPFDSAKCTSCDGEIQLPNKSLNEYKKNNPRVYKLDITRKKQLVGSYLVLIININSVPSLSVENGGTYTLNVPEGFCRIEFYFSFGLKTIIDFEIHSDVSLNVKRGLWSSKPIVQVQGGHLC